ncbi:MAG: hypothetical protein QW428_01205 [Conexivisphaerales archaeon]
MMINTVNQVMTEIVDISVKLSYKLANTEKVFYTVAFYRLHAS